MLAEYIFSWFVVSNYCHFSSNRCFFFSIHSSVLAFFQSLISCCFFLVFCAWFISRSPTPLFAFVYLTHSSVCLSLLPSLLPLPSRSFSLHSSSISFPSLLSLITLILSQWSVVYLSASYVWSLHVFHTFHFSYFLLGNDAEFWLFVCLFARLSESNLEFQ